jgi:hypothetical protein
MSLGTPTRNGPALTPFARSVGAATRSTFTLPRRPPKVVKICPLWNCRFEAYQTFNPCHAFFQRAKFREAAPAPWHKAQEENLTALGRRPPGGRAGLTSSPSDAGDALSQRCRRALTSVVHNRILAAATRFEMPLSPGHHTMASLQKGMLLKVNRRDASSQSPACPPFCIFSGGRICPVSRNRLAISSKAASTRPLIF